MNQKTPDKTETTRISAKLTRIIRKRAHDNKRTFRAEHEHLIEQSLKHDTDKIKESEI